MRSATLLVLSAALLGLVPEARGEMPVPLNTSVQIITGQSNVIAEGVPPLSGSHSCPGGTLMVDVTAPSGALEVDWSVDPFGASCPNFRVEGPLNFSVPPIRDRLIPIAFRLTRTSGNSGVTTSFTATSVYGSALLGDEYSFFPSWTDPASGATLGDSLGMPSENSASFVLPFLSGDSISDFPWTLSFPSGAGAPRSETVVLEAVVPTFAVPAPALSGWSRAAVTALLIAGAGIWFAHRRR